MPSSERRQAERSTASPPVSKCSTKRIRPSGLPQGAQHLGKAALALAERPAAQIGVAGEQKIEDIEDQIVGLLFGKSSLEGCEVGRAMRVQCDDLAVDDAVRQTLAACAAMAGNLAVQSRPLRVFSVALPSATRSCTR